MVVTPVWEGVGELLVVLAAAALLGVVANRLRASAALGAIAAGVLLGPSGLHLVADTRLVHTFAEAGVSLLLFTIGLEFSWARLRQESLRPLLGGVSQVISTAAAVTAVALAGGSGGRVSVVAGCVVAVSSTAAVLRLLGDRGELDTLHGRWAFATLLVQDVALLPLLLVVNTLGAQPGRDLARNVAVSLGGAALMVIVLALLATRALPVLLRMSSGLGNRELAVSVAVLAALGSAWAAHALGLSPALGAFVAGMLLARSDFHLQLRSDVTPLRALFMTVFFASIGMLADLGWAWSHWALVVSVSLGVVSGKAILAAGALRPLGLPWRSGIAVGLCVAQLGEFSFVLASAAEARGVLRQEGMSLVVAVMVLTFFATPLLMAGAARVAVRGARSPAEAGGSLDEALRRKGVVVVGYGPVGEAAALAALDSGSATTVVELNPELVRRAREAGHPAVLGDGALSETLRAAEAENAAVVAVTVPDHAMAAASLRHARALAPDALLVARARHRRHVPLLEAAGADIVVDEEGEVGARLAAVLRNRLRG